MNKPSEIINPPEIEKKKFDEWSYGALSSDLDNPLSDVSVANSSFSIDVWKGCPLQCAYCHIQGSVRNLDENYAMPKKVRRISKHSFVDILTTLREHTLYTPDSVLSVGTSSTEPLLPGEVMESTFDMIHTCIQLGMKNPIWIVTKAGINDTAIENIQRLSPNANIIISMTCGGLDKEIEPAQNDRFRGGKEAIEAGAKVMLYLRPIVPAWGSSNEKVVAVLERAKEQIGSGISVIAPGGLRWSEGIQHGLDIRDLQWPAEMDKLDNEKDLPDDVWDFVVAKCAEIFPGVPVVKHSSCGLSHILKVPDIGAKFLSDPENCCESVCSPAQISRCEKRRNKLLEEPIDDVNAKIRSLVNDGKVTYLGRDGSQLRKDLGGLDYVTRTSILKMLSGDDNR